MPALSTTDSGDLVDTSHLVAMFPPDADGSNPDPPVMQSAADVVAAAAPRAGAFTAADEAKLDGIEARAQRSNLICVDDAAARRALAPDSDTTNDGDVLHRLIYQASDQTFWRLTGRNNGAAVWVQQRPLPTVPDRAGAFTAADEAKLDGIEAGAEVNPTDAEIGDSAFSNPPSDLTADEQTAVRTAIGAGTATDSGSIPVGYGYHETAALANPNVTTADADSADVREFTLIDEVDFAAGIIADVDFISEWQGTVYFDTTDTATYKFVLETTHDFPNAADLVSTREFTQRVQQSELFALPLEVFNSRSVVPAGTADLDATVTITVKLKIERVTGSSTAWQVEKLYVTDGDASDDSDETGRATFWQLGTGGVADSVAWPDITGVPARVGTFTAADETKLDGLADIRSIGARLTLSGAGELSADVQDASGTSVAVHVPADGDAELAGLDIDSTDYELVDRQSRDRLHAVEQRVHPILEIPQTWANAPSAAAGWSAPGGLLTAVNTIAALTYANADVSGTTAQFVYVRIPVAAQQSTYRFRYTIGGGSQNGQTHDRVLGTWSGERVGADATWAYYRIAFFEGDTFSTGRVQIGTGTFEWEGALTRDAVQDQLDAIGIPDAITALKNVTRDLHLDGATTLVKNTAAATAGVARVAVANADLQAIEAGTKNLDVQGVTFTATLANAHFGSTANSTDQAIIRLAQTQDRSDWRILFDTTAFVAGGWVPISVDNGTAGYSYYISGKVDRTSEIALYKSTEETTFHGELADGLAVPPVTDGGGNAVSGIWRGTQAQYDAITSKDANVVYMIESSS